MDRAAFAIGIWAAAAGAGLCTGLMLTRRNYDALAALLAFFSLVLGATLVAAAFLSGGAS